MKFIRVEDVERAGFSTSLASGRGLVGMRVQSGGLNLYLKAAIRRLGRLALATAWLSSAMAATGEEMRQVDLNEAERFAELALGCIHREYPNKIAHVMLADSDVKPPRELYPAFHGCFDWHSAVHGHWLLVRILRLYPAIASSGKIEAALNQSFVLDKMKVEAAYFELKDRASFERPYGMAWLLQLCAELREWRDPRAQRWLASLEPLEKVCANRLREWLPKLAYPIRTGEHSQTAFAFGLALDWARRAGDVDLSALIEEKSRQFYLQDYGCGLRYEPSGQDFLSPCLAEADLMRRILEPHYFSAWLSRFLVEIPLDGSGSWLALGVVTDPSDGKLAHLDGLNLSRAWMLEGMASALPKGDPRAASLLAAANLHAESALAAVTGAHYEGGHWLGSFATYLVTRRGLDPANR